MACFQKYYKLLRQILLALCGIIPPAKNFSNTSNARRQHKKTIQILIIIYAFYRLWVAKFVLLQFFELSCAR